MSDITNLALLLMHVGPIEGRKKLQKIIHLLQAQGVDFDVEFELYHFGPYSAEIKSSMDELLALGLVTERVEGKGYRYEGTQNLGKFIQVIAGNETPDWIAVAKQLNSRDATELEGISTVSYLKARGWRDAELQSRFATIKPHLKAQFQHYAKESSNFE